MDNIQKDSTNFEQMIKDLFSAVYDYQLRSGQFEISHDGYLLVVNISKEE